MVNPNENILIWFATKKTFGFMLFPINVWSLAFNWGLNLLEALCVTKKPHLFVGNRYSLCIWISHLVSKLEKEILKEHTLCVAVLILF